MHQAQKPALSTSRYETSATFDQMAAKALLAHTALRFGWAVKRRYVDPAVGTGRA